MSDEATSELHLPDPPLQDERIRLRPGGEADVVDAHRATLDPLIPRFTRVPANQAQESVRRYFQSQDEARMAGEQLALVIADAETDRLLGTVALLRFQWAERRCEVGYWLAPWARGRGTATRAVRLLSHWALTEGGLARLAVHVDLDNDASQRVAERCGFTREGVLRSFEERDGRRHDIVVFSLVSGDRF